MAGLGRRPRRGAACRDRGDRGLADPLHRHGTLLRVRRRARRQLRAVGDLPGLAVRRAAREVLRAAGQEPRRARAGDPGLRAGHDRAPARPAGLGEQCARDGAARRVRLRRGPGPGRASCGRDLGAPRRGHRGAGDPPRLRRVQRQGVARAAGVGTDRTVVPAGARGPGARRRRGPRPGAGGRGAAPRPRPPDQVLARRAGAHRDVSARLHPARAVGTPAPARRPRLAIGLGRALPDRAHRAEVRRRRPGSPQLRGDLLGGGGGQDHGQLQPRDRLGAVGRGGLPRRGRPATAVGVELPRDRRRRRPLRRARRRARPGRGPRVLAPGHAHGASGGLAAP